MKQKAPSAPHRMSSKDMLKMLISRGRARIAGASASGVEPVDEIAQGVIARAVERRLFPLLHEMKDEDEECALHQRDHRAVEADPEGARYLLEIERDTGNTRAGKRCA